MRKAYLLALAPALLTTGGCVSTAAAVVKAPFQAAGKAVDWTTTSQDEADRNYGRKMRKREAREGRERAEYDKACRKDPNACTGYQGYRAEQDR